MKVGIIHAITGCMFSGKTTKLIEEIQQAESSGKNVQVFKPAVDTRFGDDLISSHTKRTYPAKSVHGSIKILEDALDETDVIAVDEAQFFDEFLPQVLNVLVLKGKTILIAGLDTDWRGRPFGPIPQILSISTQVTKLAAKCSVCGADAIRSQRLVESDQDVLIGTNEYEPRCLEHFRVPVHIGREERAQEADTQPATVN